MKVVLVTGGSQGIGAAIVKKFSTNGYIVALQYDKSKNAATLIEASYKNIHLFKEDFFSSEITLIDRVLQKLGRIDVLVNCAGIMANESIFDMDSSAFDRIFQVNTKVPFLLSSKVFEFMKSNSIQGSIVNISSFTVKYGMGRNQSIHYAASKEALECLSTGLSRLGAEFNINVNSIRPGLIETSMQQGRNGLNDRINMIPMKD
jgi:NAD(P)-dependent dehydrogenase (short-subunit alcohol dehydrogenase family)